MNKSKGKSSSKRSSVSIPWGRLKKFYIKQGTYNLRCENVGYKAAAARFRSHGCQDVAATDGAHFIRSLCQDYPKVDFSVMSELCRRIVRCMDDPVNKYLIKKTRKNLRYLQNLQKGLHWYSGLRPPEMKFLFAGGDCLKIPPLCDSLLRVIGSDISFVKDHFHKRGRWPSQVLHEDATKALIYLVEDCGLGSDLAFATLSEIIGKLIFGSVHDDKIKSPVTRAHRIRGWVDAARDYAKIKSPNK